MSLIKYTCFSEGPSNVSFYEVFPPSIYGLESEECLVADRFVSHSHNNIEVTIEAKNTSLGENIPDISLLSSYSESLKQIPENLGPSKFF